MEINYIKFLKHAEKLVKESDLESRPILQGVHHDGEGNITVTNTHYAYRAKGVNGPRDIVLHAVTGEEIEGNYPDLTRLFPDPIDARVEIPLKDIQEVIEVLQAMQYAYARGVKRRKARVSIKRNLLNLFEHDRGISFDYPIVEDESLDVSQMIFRSQYLVNSLTMFQDLGFDEATLFTFGKNKPVVIAVPEKLNLQALILPKRS